MPNVTFTSALRLLSVVEFKFPFAQKQRSPATTLEVAVAPRIAASRKQKPYEPWSRPMQLSLH